MDDMTEHNQSNSRVRKSRRPVLVGCGGLFVLALVGIGTTFYLQFRDIAALRLEQVQLRAELKALPLMGLVHDNRAVAEGESGTGSILEALGALKTPPMENDALLPRVGNLGPLAPNETYTEDSLAAMAAFALANEVSIQAFITGVSRPRILLPDLGPDAGDDAFNQALKSLRRLRDTVHIALDCALASGNHERSRQLLGALASADKLYDDGEKIPIYQRMGVFQDYISSVERALNTGTLPEPILSGIRENIEFLDFNADFKASLIPMVDPAYPATAREYLSVEFPGILLAQSPLPESVVERVAGRSYEASKVRTLENVLHAYHACDSTWALVAPEIVQRESNAETLGNQVSASTETSPYAGLDELLAARARLRLARITLAVEDYRTANGVLPASLDAMADITEREDPYDGQPIRYVPDGNGYLLYCVGENLVDDGGVEYHKRSEQQEKGDIVFQVRR